MRRVIIESPYRGRGSWLLPRLIDKWKNIWYARLCLKDSISRGEAPLAFHLLHTQPGVLRDRIEHERELGLNIGMEWLKAADVSVVYCDRGMTPGMSYGRKTARSLNIPIEYRYILNHRRV